MSAALRRRLIFWRAVAGGLLIACLALAWATWNARIRWAVPEGAVFVGSVKSRIFHRPDCRHARRIPVGNRVWFRSAEEALDGLCRPCKVCKAALARTDL